VFGDGERYGGSTFRRIALLMLLAKLMDKSVEFRLLVSIRIIDVEP